MVKRSNRGRLLADVRRPRKCMCCSVTFIPAGAYKDCCSLKCHSQTVEASLDFHKIISKKDEPEELTPRQERRKKRRKEKLRRKTKKTKKTKKKERKPNLVGKARIQLWKGKELNSPEQLRVHIHELEKSISVKDLLEAAQKNDRAAKKTLEMRKRFKNENDLFFMSYAWQCLRERTFKTYGRRCMKCYRAETILHVDHIKPRSIYPHLEYEFENLQILCDRCNFEKSNIDETDYRELMNEGSKNNDRR